jgi:hypothetical protein
LKRSRSRSANARCKFTTFYPIISAQAQLAPVKEVINIDAKTIVALVLGVAMFIIALITLMVKLIELSQK